MDNTIPFNLTSCTVRTEQITVDVSILSVLLVSRLFSAEIRGSLSRPPIAAA